MRKMSKWSVSVKRPEMLWSFNRLGLAYEQGAYWCGFVTAA